MNVPSPPRHHNLDTLAAGQLISFGAAIPAALQPSVRRHHRNLVLLVTSLRQAGVEEGQIETSLTTLIASYQAELLAALRTLNQDDPA